MVLEKTLEGLLDCKEIKPVNRKENQFGSVAQSCPTLCNPMDCSVPGFPVLYQLLELTQTHVHDESVMPYNHLILCHSLLLLSSIFPSIRVFSNESVLCIRWSKYWSFNFSISLSNEYSRLISFWVDWLDLLAVQGALKSLLQHHSSKASIFQRSAFFIVQLSHPYTTTGKTIALTRRTFVGIPVKICTIHWFQLYMWVCVHTYGHILITNIFIIIKIITIRRQ